MSLLSSTIIQDIEALCEAREASMAYFYFDFRDANKQSMRDLVTSFLTQLSAGSSLRCDVLSKLYLFHDGGKRQPSESVLTKTLKGMLTLPDQRPIYLIMDALDESPDTSGIPTARERVLQLLKELIDLRLPNVHICVTSRPEVDIQDVILALTSLQVSLQDQSGRKEDIADYVKAVVYSSMDPIMRRWRKEDKDLVIEVLSERANGVYVKHLRLLCLFELSNRFRWVFCQLEVLRRCLPTAIRRFLDELPESLDETYERVLREIKEGNQDHARRIMRCLVVAIRPLRVEELAEVLAVDFDDTKGIIKLKPDWHWEYQEQPLLTACSSLISIVGTGRSRVVQFSHYSVKEFLTSARLATSSGDVSRYHIALEPAHTILAIACLSTLLRPGDHADENDIGGRSPLTRYAVRHWVTHAQFEMVSTHLRKAMEDFFDPDKPYFAAWCQLHDIDTHPSDTSVFYQFTPTSKSGPGTPLYYAALCGFQDLVEHLVIKYPQHVGAIGGYYMTTAVAALARRHFQVAKLLYHHGSSVNVRGHYGWSPLHSAVYYGDLEMVQVLLNNGVDVMVQDEDGCNPVHRALSWGRMELVRILTEHPASEIAQGKDRWTPIPQAPFREYIGVAQMVFNRDLDVTAHDRRRLTPLHLSSGGHVKLALILELILLHNAGSTTQYWPGWILSHPTLSGDHIELTHLLLEHGANADARDDDNCTPLHWASQQGHSEVVLVLVEHGVDADARDDNNRTPLHWASQLGHSEVVSVLVEHGIDINARDHSNWTPLHGASQNGHWGVVQFLLDHGANAHASDQGGWTPLQWPSYNGYPQTVRILLERGADANTRDNTNWTPLHGASKSGHPEVVQVLLEHGADANSRDDSNQTPLHLASRAGHLGVVQLLVENSANTDLRNNEGRTPLEEASVKEHRDVIQLLLGRRGKEDEV